MGIVYAKELDSQRNVNITSVGQTSSNRHFNSSYDGHSKPPKGQIEIKGVKARVDRINVIGLMRTKDDIIRDAVKDLLHAQDFQDVMQKASKVRQKLDSLGCFKNIGIYIDTSSGPKSTPDGLEVTFYVKELKRLVGGVSTSVGNNGEGNLVVGLKAPNTFGRGERIQTEYSYGSRRTNNISIGYIKPFRGRWNSIFTTSVFQAGSEWPWSGYKMVDRGLTFDFQFYSAPYVKHNLQWEGAIRDLSVLNRSTSFLVRELSGPSLKSSVKHILSVDHRDQKIFPTGGSLFQLTSEFAGLGGNVGFIKNDVLLQYNYSLLEDVVIQGALNSGVLRGLSDKTVGLCDQFYLGGPLTLRGFNTRGVGPHSDGNALGSDVFWAAALHLYTPLPFRPGKGGFGDNFRTHFFINFGNIGNFKFSDDYQHNLKVLTESVRAAYGVGIAFRIADMARVELNYCVPTLFKKGDQVSSGVQFGLGVQFL